MSPTVKLTYRRWLTRQRDRDDPVGDLARDVELDTYQVTTPTALLRHIYRMNGLSTAKAAARQAHHEWMAARPHHSTPEPRTT